MKRAYLLLFVLCTLVASAQDKSAKDKECRKLQSAVDSIAKKGDYDKAFMIWTDLRKKCPAFSDKVYTSGAELLKIKADRANAQDKEIAAKELLKLYDDYNKNIPSNRAPIALYKASAMDRYRVGSEAEIYQLLDAAYAKNPASFNDVAAIYRYLELYVNKFKAGDKTITANKILRKKDDLAAHIEQLTEAAPANAKANQRILQSMDALLKGIATCDNLDAYYGEVFEKRKTDTLWLAVALKALSAANCRSSKMYTAITEAQQGIKPTAQSAYNLGVAAYQKANMQEAGRYFLQSAELEKDPLEKANTYFTLASTVYAGNKPKQKEFAKKALEAKPDFAKSYILLAQLYAEATDCAANDFEKKALNWLAADMLKKAISVDKNKGGLQKLVLKYEQKAPSAKEIKDSKMAGQTINFGCWINESVIVPSDRK